MLVSPPPPPSFPLSLSLSFSFFLLGIYSGVPSSRDSMCKFLRCFQINEFKKEKVIIDFPWWCSLLWFIGSHLKWFCLHMSDFQMNLFMGKKRWNMWVYKNDGYLYLSCHYSFLLFVLLYAFISLEILKKESRSTP